MTLRLSPPPLQLPPAFGKDKLINAFFSGLLNTVYQLWTAVYSLRYQSKVKTTDATLTGLIRTTIPDGKTILIQAYVIARRTGGVSGTVGDSAFYVLTGAYKNIGGVLTGIGTADLISGEDQAGWNVAFTTSALDAVVVVQGVAGNDITWEGTISTYAAGA